MVDKSTIIPLYEQVARELRREILCNQYGEHGSIGTQNQLAERFAVSLITIRKAIQILEQEGMVDIQQGKGTFVRHTTLVDPLHNLTGVSNMMKDLQVKTDVVVPIFEMRNTPEWIPRDVKVQLGASSLYILRVVSVQGKPFANTEMYLPSRYAAGFTKAEVEAYTVYQIYQNKLNVSLGKGRQIIRAVGAHGDIAKNLDLPDNWPLLQIERQAFDVQGGLIEYMILSYEASKYSFEVEMDLKT